MLNEREITNLLNQIIPALKSGNKLALISLEDQIDSFVKEDFSEKDKKELKFYLEKLSEGIHFKFKCLFVTSKLMLKHVDSHPEDSFEFIELLGSQLKKWKDMLEEDND